jgi:hypothetical protein
MLAPCLASMLRHRSFGAGAGPEWLNAPTPIRQRGTGDIVSFVSGAFAEEATMSAVRARARQLSASLCRGRAQSRRYCTPDWQGGRSTAAGTGSGPRPRRGEGVMVEAVSGLPRDQARRAAGRIAQGGARSWTVIPAVYAGGPLCRRPGSPPGQIALSLHDPHPAAAVGPGIGLMSSGQRVVTSRSRRPGSVLSSASWPGGVPESQTADPERLLKVRQKCAAGPLLRIAIYVG